MEIEKLLRIYQAQVGGSLYRPVMMTEVIRENMMLMLLIGNNKLDFRTLNSFRGKMLKEVMEARAWQGSRNTIHYDNGQEE